jgi:lipoate-protein ligase A
LDPYFNLAYEENLINNDSSDGVTLFMWQSKNAVVIGSNQNPWKECNLQKLNCDNVSLARRLSGGGAVFHDLGNINFCFVANKKLYNEENQFKVIIDAISEFGITSKFSGRNDILVNGKKISGNAYYYDDDMCLHHGTLLIDADLTKLAQYLTVSKKKLISKGINSVVSRVVNLKEINSNISVKAISLAIQESFMKNYGECKLNKINEESILDEKFDKLLQKYSSWEWIYGNSPMFEMIFDERFDWGEMQINAEIKDAIIKNVQIYSDSLNLVFISKLKSLLTNIRNDKDAIAKAISLEDWTDKEKQMINNIMEKWFAMEVYCG